MTEVELRNKVFKDKETTIAFCEKCKFKEKYEKQKEINKELVDCNARLLDQVGAATKRAIELEKENAELKSELTKKADTNHSLVEQMADLESENARGYRDTMIMRYEEDDEEKLHWTDGDGDCWDDDVIAWREIPKFEETA